MNKILTTSISDPTIQQPFTGHSLDFLQNANKEVALGLARMLADGAYSSSNAYVISGLEQYGTNQYSGGYVLYGEEIYSCDGKSTTTAFVNTAVLTLTVTNDATSDPITFTDGVPRNVHNVRKMVMSDAVSGTGTVDYSNCIFYNRSIAYAPTLTAYTTADVLVGGGVTSASGFAFYRRTQSGVKIYFTSYDLSTTATTAKIVISLPFAIPTTGGSAKLAYGISQCSFFKTGVGTISTFANIALSSGGSGTPLTIEKHDRTAFGVLANYDKVFFCIDIVWST